MYQIKNNIEELSAFCCQNPICPDYDKRGMGNLTVCALYGRHQRRLLYCRTCRERFSERKGTPFFHNYLSDTMVARILELIDDGYSQREISRQTGVSRMAIHRISQIAVMQSHR